MKDLLIVAHGSKLEESNQEIRDLAQVLAAKGKGFGSVSFAFLEASEPSIESALEKIFKREITDVTVLPLFISAGKHVKQDIPAAISQLLERWPDRKVSVMPHIGTQQWLSPLIATIFE